MSFDSLAKQVAATNSVHGSAVALLSGIASQLSAGLASQPVDNGAQLRALLSSLTQQSQSLAAAISANTPAGVSIPVAPTNPPNTPLTPTSYGYDPAVPMVPVTPVHGTTAPEPYGRPVVPEYGTPGAPNESPATPYDDRNRAWTDEERAKANADRAKRDAVTVTSENEYDTARDAREAQEARDKRNALMTTPGSAATRETSATAGPPFRS